MKLFTVEVVKQGETGHVEIGGRNCRDVIRVGDDLAIESNPQSVVRVVGIEVYRKNVEELHHGYVGTLFVERISGDNPQLEDKLTSP